jgi:hypothetical protein
MNGESVPKGPLTRSGPDDHYAQSTPESFAEVEPRATCIQKRRAAARLKTLM